MTRDEAKELFRGDTDSYGKPKAPMTKLDNIYDDFEALEALFLSFLQRYHLRDRWEEHTKDYEHYKRENE